MALTPAQKVYVEEILSLSPLLSFNAEARTFDITAPDLSWERIESLGPAIRKLRNTPPPPPAFSGVRLAEFFTGYYDNCLEDYLVQRAQGMCHEDTCWIRHAQRTFCVGRVAPTVEFDDGARDRVLEDLARRRDSHIYHSIGRASRKDPALRRALKKDADGWLLLMGDIPVRSLLLRKRIRAAGAALARKIAGVPEVDRVVGIVRSIESRGWSNELARTPSASVLGYSRSTRRYMAMTGRHRMAAVRYLYRQRKIDGSTFIEAPVITYPWASWMHGRPHPDTPLCDRCR